MLRSGSKSAALAQSQIGFTLMETVIAIILLAIASTLIIMLQSTLSMVQVTARSGQSIIEARQECAEEILMIRQKGWESEEPFVAISSNKLWDPDDNPSTPPQICEALWNAMGKDLAATRFISEPFSVDRPLPAGVTGAFCPPGYTCIEVYIPAAGRDRTFLTFNDSDSDRQ